MYCKQCGFQLDSGTVSCPNCGTQAGEGNNFCQQCGTPRMGNDNFCSVCGYSFTQTTTVLNNDYMGGTAPVSAQQNNVNNVSNSGNGFDFKAYAGEWLKNLKSVLAIQDKMEMALRYASYAVSVLVFFLMMFPVISVHIEAIFYEYTNGSNLFAVSAFGAMMYIFALLASVATFLPHVQSFIENNKKLSPFVYLIVPFLELVGMMSMLIGVGVTNTAVNAYFGELASVRLGFIGWLILILTLAAVGGAVYHVIRYDLAYIKANNPFVTTVNKPKDTITNAMNNTYNDTVYRGDDVRK